jgi:hypothetical protein
MPIAAGSMLCDRPVKAAGSSLIPKSCEPCVLKSCEKAVTKLGGGVGGIVGGSSGGGGAAVAAVLVVAAVRLAGTARGIRKPGNQSRPAWNQTAMLPVTPGSRSRSRPVTPCAVVLENKNDKMMQQPRLIAEAAAQGTVLEVYNLTGTIFQK